MTIRRSAVVAFAVLLTMFCAGCDLREAQWHADLAAEMYDLARYYPENNRIALEQLETLIAAHPGAPGIDAAFYFRARCMARLEYPGDQVLAACNELTTRFPESKYLYLMNKWRAQQPGIPDVRPAELPLADRQFLDAMHAFDMQDQQQALTLFTDFIANYPESPEIRQALYYQARCLHIKMTYSQAEPAYREIIRRFPGTSEAVRAKNHLGWVLFARLRQVDAALALYDEMLQENRDHPNYGWVWADLGECYRKKNDNARALAAFEQAALLREDLYLWNGERAYQYAQRYLPQPEARGYLFPGEEEEHVIGVIFSTH